MCNSLPASVETTDTSSASVSMCLKTWFCLSDSQYAASVEASRHSYKSHDTSVSHGAMLNVWERPTATVGLGERDHLLIITDTDVSAKVEHAKTQNNKLKADRRSPREELRQRTGSAWLQVP